MRILLSLFKVIAFTTVVVTIMPVTEGLSAYGQDAVEETSAAVKLVAPTSHVDPVSTLTTQYPDIPIEELELLVRPLTLAQLEDEAATWLLILQDKVQEISDTAIAVKRENRVISTRQESPQALKGDRRDARQALVRAIRLRQEMTVDSAQYKQATEKIDGLETAIAEIEKVTGTLTNTIAGTPEHEAAETVLAQSRVRQKQVLADLLQTLPMADREPAVGDLDQASTAVDVQVLPTHGFIEDAPAEFEALKTHLVAVVIELQSDRTAIADRFKIVLDELDKKGGDSATYRNYIEASDGIVIDFKDIGGLGMLLVNWIKAEEGGLRLFLTLGRTLGAVIGFFLFGLIADRFYNLIHHRVLPSLIEAQVLPILQTVSKITLWVVVIVLCLGSIGLEVSAILTGFGIGGLAIALAAQDTLSNILGGFTLLLQGKVTLGQRVEIAGIKAKIQEIGLRTTTLIDLDYDYQVVIPNRKFLQQVVNYIDSRPHYAIYETLHLHSSSTFEQILLAIDLIQKVAADNEHIKGARPVFSDFNDYAFDIKLVFWIKKWTPEEKALFPSDLWKISMVRSQMNLGILQQFEAHGLKLALPIQLKELPQTYQDGIFSSNAGNCQNSIHKIEASSSTKDGSLLKMGGRAGRR